MEVGRGKLVVACVALWPDAQLMIGRFFPAKQLEPRHTIDIPLVSDFHHDSTGMILV